MNTQTTSVAGATAHDLRALEAAIDAALGRAGQLMTTLTEGRQVAGLASSVGHAALLQLGASISAGLEMRGRVIRTHGQLTSIADRLGLSSDHYGPGEDKLPEDETETPKGLLVGTEARTG